MNRARSKQPRGVEQLLLGEPMLAACVRRPRPRADYVGHLVREGFASAQSLGASLERGAHRGTLATCRRDDHLLGVDHAQQAERVVALEFGLGFGQQQARVHVAAGHRAQARQRIGSLTRGRVVGETDGRIERRARPFIELGPLFSVLKRDPAPQRQRDRFRDRSHRERGTDPLGELVRRARLPAVKQVRDLDRLQPAAQLRIEVGVGQNLRRVRRQAAAKLLEL